MKLTNQVMSLNKSVRKASIKAKLFWRFLTSAVRTQLVYTNIY